MVYLLKEDICHMFTRNIGYKPIDLDECIRNIKNKKTERMVITNE